jgi:AcrR family transcriptional regulator
MGAMARQRSTDFLDRLLAAAMTVFAQKGLQRARMSDVAREMGVAHGSLYNYVESKDALFYLLVDRGADPPSGWKPKTWPVRTPSRARLMKRLREQIAAGFALPQLDAALERRRVPDIRAELEGIVRELYERTERTREQATVITRSAADLPDFFKLFFVQVRRQLIGRLTRYVQSRIEDGYFPAGLDPAAAGRFVLETVTTFARHRYADPDPQPLNDAAVRATVVRVIVRGLLADQEGTSTDSESFGGH